MMADRLTVFFVFLASGSIQSSPTAPEVANHSASKVNLDKKIAHNRATESDLMSVLFRTLDMQTNGTDELETDIAQNTSNETHSTRTEIGVSPHPSSAKPEKKHIRVGSTPKTTPATELLSAAVARMGRVVCHFNSSSANRDGNGRFLVRDMNATYCSDLYYDQAVIMDETFQLQAISDLNILPIDDNFFLPAFTVINDFKLANPKLKTFLTVTDSPVVPFSSLVLDYSKNKAFVKSCVRNLLLWGFDGMNIKWLYPPQPQQLTRLLKDLNFAFKNSRTQLHLGVILAGHLRNLEEFYEVHAIYNIADYVSVLAFRDLSNTPVHSTRLASPLYSKHDTRANVDEENGRVLHSNVSTNHDYPEEGHVRTKRLYSSRHERSTQLFEDVFSIDWLVKEFVRLGADLSKLNVAISLIGQGYILKDSKQNGIGAPSVGLSSPGLSGIAGFNASMWVSFEDLESVAQKVDYLKEHWVEGIVLMSQSEDDYNGTNCGRGMFPISKLVYDRSSFDVSQILTKKYPWEKFCGAAQRPAAIGYERLLLATWLAMSLVWM